VRCVSRAAAALGLALLLLAPKGDAIGKDMQSCVISVTPLRFGNFNLRSPSELMMTGDVVFNCAESQPVTIFMDHGSTPGVGMRTMRGPGVIDYNIYFDAAATRVWGNGTGGTQFYSNSAPPPRTNVVIPFYGRIPNGQRSERVGAFTDSVVVRLNY
jgi:spore coat protein U-like protein